MAAESLPAAAGFLRWAWRTAQPDSPNHDATNGGDGRAAGMLCVLTADGVLSTHALRLPRNGVATGQAGAEHGCAPRTGAAPSAPHRVSRCPLESIHRMLDCALAATCRSSAEASGGGAALGGALEEHERWDICRQVSWPEREEALPGAASSALGPAATAAGTPVALFAAPGPTAAAAEPEQRWAGRFAAPPALPPGQSLHERPQFRLHRLLGPGDQGQGAGAGAAEPGARGVWLESEGPALAGGAPAAGLLDAWPSLRVT